ncbi:hypothetical protein [Brevibacterium sediminis]
MAPGRDANSSYSRHVVARFADFTNPKTPWPRRLWDLGTFLALEELHDVGIWLDRNVLSPSAVNWLQRDLEPQLGQDVGFGTNDVRKQLTQCLRSELKIKSDGRRRLRHVIDTAREGYLERWTEKAASNEPPGAERVARAAASHLLDAGHSLHGLRRWLEGRSALSAADLLTETAMLAAQRPRLFRLWVPVFNVPQMERLADPLPNFSRNENLELAIAGKFEDKFPKPTVGAFQYEVEARDAERAAEVVVEVVERMQARARFAGPIGRIDVAPSAYVESENRFIDLRIPDRGAAIMSLVAESQLLAVGPAKTYSAERHAIDDALELAAPLYSGPLAPAISGSWAALEALLTDAQDTDQNEGKVVAATNAARLAACSWPRAELTALSYQVDSKRAAKEEWFAQLKNAKTNRDRSAVIADRLTQESYLPLKRTWRIQSDAAAVTRMKNLLTDPTYSLNQVSGYIEASLRRLYRCRNVIVHGGSTRGDVLDSTLRVAAPLVGATLDRLTHAHLVLMNEPLHLATRADAAIDMASDKDMGLPVVDLLGHM